MSLVSTDWLEKNLTKVKIIDGSWHMPATKRSGKEEYEKQHIPNAIFFDIDENCKKSTELPHMLTDSKSWEKIVSSLGISNNDEVVIYDNSDVLSACRVWFNLIYFGHDKEKVHVLDGGFYKWKDEKRKISTNNEIIQISNYIAKENINMVKSKEQVDSNINLNEFDLVDARSRDRFDGNTPDPRKNVKSGSIPNSVCLPFKTLINDNYTFKNKAEISTYFKELSLNDDINVVFSCGSGITACVLALAYSLVNNKYLPVIYDGSWAEYGKI